MSADIGTALNTALILHHAPVMYSTPEDQIIFEKGWYEAAATNLSHGLAASVLEVERLRSLILDACELLENLPKSHVDVEISAIVDLLADGRLPEVAS